MNEKEYKERMNAFDHQCYYLARTCKYEIVETEFPQWVGYLDAIFIIKGKIDEIMDEFYDSDSETPAKDVYREVDAVITRGAMYLIQDNDYYRDGFYEALKDMRREFDRIFHNH